MSRAVPLLLFLALALPLGALAQTVSDAGVSTEDGGTDGGTRDGGGLPDASVGEGGADRDNEQGDDTTGRVVTVCDRASDCSAGFSCVQGRCTWIGIREAEGGFGCGGGQGALAALVLPFAVLLTARFQSTRRCSGSAARRTRPRRR